MRALNRGANRYSVRKITSLDEFKGIADEWNVLADHLGNPLLRHELFISLISASFTNGHLYVIAVYDAHKLVAAAPLVLRRFFGVRRLEFISQNICEPSGLLYLNEESLRELIFQLFETRFPFLLSRLNRNDPELRIVKSVARDSTPLITTDGGTTLCIPLTADYSALEKQVSSSRRQTLRRCRRRAEALGRVEFLAYAPHGADVDPLLNEVFRIEGSGWKGKSKSAVLSSRNREMFFRLYAHALAQSNMLRIYLMKIDGVAIACRLAACYKNVLYDLKIGYDESYGKLSPGFLLFHETLRFCYQDGLTSYNSLGTAADWQMIWPHEEKKWQTLRYVPRRPSGVLILSGEMIRIALMRVRQRADAHFRPAKTPAPMGADVVERPTADLRSIH
ncbi:GNAT family N-acetyltransferase [Methylobacterium nodulans]|uniref:BioF2-like acetyltransferase domain-containing protein n=1 Tax=Methylobacterium nodulans (strain LMG 21967 / CNCM I-2342 / ORS 2060) TaxID=460265 RepID=B8IFB6_METNO|nr:GNAT family N-acetyltransferase [Methylobacterium nodulans]ACL57651.1 hypothetical protein Mnod_2693 [Methylobacterium nodulans ORS 2060]